jgi:hypothetical protein
MVEAARPPLRAGSTCRPTARTPSTEGLAVPVSARRVLGVVVVVLGVALSVIGAWTALRLGVTGEARFSVASPAPGAVVIEPNVLNSVDVPVRVTATRSDGGAVRLVAAPSADARAVLGKSTVSTVMGVLADGTLDLRPSGTGALSDISSSDVWRLSAAGSGSAQLVVDQGRGPETAIVTSGDASSLRDVTLTLTWADRTWFFEALSVGVIGAMMAAFALGGLWHTRAVAGQREARATRSKVML